MTIFRLNFLLKVGQMKVCQNPSFISTKVDQTVNKKNIYILQRDTNGDLDMKSKLINKESLDCALFRCKARRKRR